MADKQLNENDTADAALLDPKRLLTQLNLLKRDPARRAHFAFVDASDRRDAVLAIDPKVAGRKLFTKLQEATGVKIGAFGSAWVDGVALVLQLDKPMSGLVKKVRASLRVCGFRVANVVLWDADGTVLEESTEPVAALENNNSATAPANPANPTSTVDAQRARFDQSLRELSKPLQAALAGQHPAAIKLRELIAFARNKAQAGEFAPAIQALDAARKLLSPSPRTEYARCSKAWAVTQNKMAGDIKRLREAILTEYKGTPLFAEVATKVKQLDALVQHFDADLAVVLEQAATANDEATRSDLHRRAVTSVHQMLARLDTDPVLRRLKDNPFLPIDPHAALNATLQVLAHQLA